MPTVAPEAREVELDATTLAMLLVLADRRETAKAATYYEEACTKDVAIGCVGLGLLTRDGRGVPKDAARAKAPFQKACKAGVTAGCKLEGTVK
jgi:TPR repeat protein